MRKCGARMFLYVRTILQRPRAMKRVIRIHYGEMYKAFFFLSLNFFLLSLSTNTLFSSLTIPLLNSLSQSFHTILLMVCLWRLIIQDIFLFILVCLGKKYFIYEGESIDKR